MLQAYVKTANCFNYHYSLRYVHKVIRKHGILLSRCWKIIILKLNVFTIYRDLGQN